MWQAVLQRMHFHSPIYPPTNEDVRFSRIEPIKEIMRAQSFGGYATPKIQPFGSSYPFGKPYLIYDGRCNFCATATRILHALDRTRRFEYVPSQQLSANARFLFGFSEEDLQGQMYLIRSDGSIVSGPAAIAEIFKLSKAPLGFICNFLYTSQARRLYVWVARHRYRLFGCRDTCYAVYPQRPLGPD